MPYQAKGDTEGCCPGKLCPNLWECGEEFYSNSSREGLLIRLGCVEGLHSFNLASDSLLILMNFQVPLILPLLILMSFSGFYNLVLGGFLTASPLSLHPLPSVISSCRNLPSWNSGKVMEAKRSLFPVIRNGGPRKAFVPRRPIGSCYIPEY